MKLRDLMPFVSYVAKLQLVETERGRKEYTRIFPKCDLITRGTIQKLYPELLDRELSDGIHGEGFEDGIYIHLYKESKEEKIMNLVKKICGTESTDCRSLNKSDLGRQLLDIANVPKNADIQEIPLDWDNQVVVLFLLPNDTNYYSLFAGIGLDGKFYFELTITGKLNGKVFDFFDEEEQLDIDYFKKRK